MNAPAPLDEIIADLCARQKELAAMLDGETDPDLIVKLFSLHGLNAVRIGQLLRTRQALQGATTDRLEQGIYDALAELEAHNGWHTTP